MKGKIVITCDEHGVHMDMQVKTDRDSDRAFLTHALGKALGLVSEDYLVISMAEATGILDGVDNSASISIDRNELLKQLKEEQLES